MKQVLKYSFFYCLVLILFLGINEKGTAQSDTLKSIVNNLNTYSEHHFQEKVFLHIDKGVYLTGEKLWFKVYLVNAFNHKPADLSKVAYIEILDSKNVPLVQTKVNLKDGEGDGSIEIGSKLPTGNYIVRAYTNWMKNFNQEFFFHNKIKIINPSGKKESPVANKSPEYDIQFFPEGGSLVDGLLTKVAFKVTDKSGKGIYFKGYILNERNDTLVKFTPFKFGMGNFSFSPEASVKYKSLIVSSDGIKHWADLPEVLPKGYVMNLIDETDDKIRLEVVLKSENNHQMYEPVFLVGHKQGLIQIAEMFFLQNGKANFVIDKKKLTSGINYFTLFNKEKEALCERLFFKYSEHPLGIEAKINKETYHSREKVTLDFFSNNAADSAESSYSVSVFLTDTLEDVYEQDIYAYLWLSSELRGYIESPGFYFQKENKDATVALDNLLLTQGWRRFDWHEVFKPASTSLSFIPEYEGLLITAVLRDKTNNALLKNTNLYVSCPGKPGQLAVTKSNAEGEIFIPFKNITGFNNVIFQTDPNTPAPSIELKACFSEKFAAYPLSPLRLERNYKASILDRRVNQSVSKAYGYNNEKEEILQTQIPFYGKADKTYFLDDYTRFTKMEDVLKEYVPEVFVRRKKEDFYFLVNNSLSTKIFEDSPLTVIDGVPMFDSNKIISLDPKKIEKLDVITRRYFYGDLNSPGIISYSSYKGDMGGLELDPRSVVIEYEGLQKKRKFYSPQYEDQNKSGNRVPDYRNLLYWNPELKSGGQKVTNLDFYTSDQKGVYTILIQGLGKDGKAGTSRLKLEVKNSPSK